MHFQARPESVPLDNSAAAPVERRTGQVVREHFEEGCALLAPFFDLTMRWGSGPLNHLAMRALRERFCDLTSAELMVMLNGIRHLHASRRTPAPFSRP